MPQAVHMTFTPRRPNQLFWTEDNRLHTVVDDRHHSYYAYDHAGERTLKVTGHSHQLDVNADLMHTAAGLDEFTLYPSPYLVFTNRGYTKHYYAGSERLAARLGGGFDRPVVGGDHGLSQLATALFEQCQKETEKRVLEAIPPHTIRRDHLSENIYMAMIREFEIPMHLVTDAVIKSNNLLSTAQNIVSGNAEPEVYFYHSDHLGSASWITDGSGTPVQHLQYLPFGEPFVNQRNSGYNERFTFTGKERDEETGFRYFGARYMDYELMTGWLSVDPLADKYPSISPYAYCAWNPIKFVDPDGRKIWLPNGDYYIPNMESSGLGKDDAAIVDALNTICQSEEGLLMLNVICNQEDNHVFIHPNSVVSRNDVIGPPEAFYNVDKDMLGSGKNVTVDIFWNQINPEKIHTLNGMEANATYNLLDEICHAYDYCTGYGNPSKVGEVYEKNEFQAAYRSNIVRHQLGDYNYRKFYYVSNDGKTGSGHRCAGDGVIYRPWWYPRAETDKVSIPVEY